MRFMFRWIFAGRDASFGSLAGYRQQEDRERRRSLGCKIPVDGRSFAELHRLVDIETKLAAIENRAILYLAVSGSYGVRYFFMGFNEIETRKELL